MVEITPETSVRGLQITDLSEKRPQSFWDENPPANLYKYTDDDLLDGCINEMEFIVNEAHDVAIIKWDDQRILLQEIDLRVRPIVEELRKRIRERGDR